MALNLTQANRILEKLALDPIRPANHFERQYGRWVCDQGVYQQYHGWDTIAHAMASILRQHWSDISKSYTTLTEAEQRELQALIP